MKAKVFRLIILQLHFNGAKIGRRLNRTKFRSQEGFLEELETSDSNAIFVKTLSKLGVGQKKKKRHNRPNANTNAMPDPLFTNMMAITFGQSEELEFVKNKFVGTLLIRVYIRNLYIRNSRKKKLNSKLNFINY